MMQHVPTDFLAKLDFRETHISLNATNQRTPRFSELTQGQVTSQSELVKLAVSHVRGAAGFNTRCRQLGFAKTKTDRDEPGVSTMKPS